MQSWSLEFLEISYAWEPEIIWFSIIFSLNSSAVGPSAATTHPSPQQMKSLVGDKTHDLQTSKVNRR